MLRKTTQLPGLFSFRTDKVSLLLFLSLIIIFYHAIIGALLSLPILAAVKSSLFQIVCIVLPGTAIYILLYQKPHSLFCTACLCYIFGYAGNILSYFSLVPFGLKEYAPLFAVILTVASAFVLIRYNSLNIISASKQEYIFTILFFFYLCVYTTAYSAANASPALTESAYLPTDQLYWIENAAALAKGFPVINPRVYINQTMYYHYFSSIQIAYCSIVTGIDCFTLATALFSLGKCFIFFGALYVILTDLTKNFFIQLFGILTICFSDGFGGGVPFTYTSHIWTHPFGYDVGFAFGLLFLHCFYQQYQSPKINPRMYLLTVLLCCLCTGLKAPVAVIVVAAAGIVCICWLFQKQYKLAFGYGTGILFAFLLVSFFCIGLGVRQTANKVGSFAWLHSIHHTYPYSYFQETWPAVVKDFVMLIVTFLYHNTLVFGLFFFCLPCYLFCKTLRTPKNYGLIFAALLGILLGSCNRQPDASEMYFSMSAIIPSFLIGIIGLDYLSSKWNSSQKKYAAVFLSSLLIFQMQCLLFQSSTYWGNGLVHGLKKGLQVMFSREDAIQEFQENILQKEDLEALYWIRDNTPENSVILSDRSVLCNLPDFMYYGAFSERQAYLEGDIYSRSRFTEERALMRTVIDYVFQNNNRALQIAANDGVDYILQTKWLTPGFSPNPEFAVPVFSGDTINVYQIRETSLIDPNLSDIFFLNGSGTQEDPYLIGSVNDFQIFRDCVNYGMPFTNQYFLQTADLDLASINNWTPIGIFGGNNYFEGCYDGGGHVIRNLTCDDPSANIGLFGILCGEVRNLGIESGTIRGLCTGAIASHGMGAAKIYNCYNKATVHGSIRAGGIADNFAGDIIHCLNMGAITSDTGIAAGLVSYNCNSIAYSYSSTVPVTTSYFSGVCAESYEIEPDTAVQIQQNWPKPLSIER